MNDFKKKQELILYKFQPVKNFLFVYFQYHGDLEKGDDDDYSGSGDEDDEDIRGRVSGGRGYGKGSSYGGSSGSDRDTISGSGDGPIISDDEDDDRILRTHVNKPIQPDSPVIPEIHSQFAWLHLFICLF